MDAAFMKSSIAAAGLLRRMGRLVPHHDPNMSPAPPFSELGHLPRRGHPRQSAHSSGPSAHLRNSGFRPADGRYTAPHPTTRPLLRSGCGSAAG